MRGDEALEGAEPRAMVTILTFFVAQPMRIESVGQPSVVTK